jgi:hypothetical protein
MYPVVFSTDKIFTELDQKVKRLHWRLPVLQRQRTEIICISKKITFNASTLNLYFWYCKIFPVEPSFP